MDNSAWEKQMFSAARGCFSSAKGAMVAVCVCKLQLQDGSKLSFSLQA